MTITPERPASLVGASVRRVNDPRLLRGEGRYVDDVHLANLRRKLRTDAAKALGHEWIRTIRGVGFRFDPCCP